MYALQDGINRFSDCDRYLWKAISWENQPFYFYLMILTMFAMVLITVCLRVIVDRVRFQLQEREVITGSAELTFKEINHGLRSAGKPEDLRLVRKARGLFILYLLCYYGTFIILTQVLIFGAWSFLLKMGY